MAELPVNGATRLCCPTTEDMGHAVWCESWNLKSWPDDFMLEHAARVIAAATERVTDPSWQATARDWLSAYARIARSG